MKISLKIGAMFTFQKSPNDIYIKCDLIKIHIYHVHIQKYKFNGIYT